MKTEGCRRAAIYFHISISVAYRVLSSSLQGQSQPCSKISAYPESVACVPQLFLCRAERQGAAALTAHLSQPAHHLNATSTLPWCEIHTRHIANTLVSAFVHLSIGKTVLQRGFCSKLPELGKENGHVVRWLNESVPWPATSKISFRSCLMSQL